MEDALVRLETWVKNDDTAVLILVLMEDALAPPSSWVRGMYIARVLILVVMEDALALYINWFVWAFHLRLNPCCNGRCTRTDKKKSGRRSKSLS